MSQIPKNPTDSKNSSIVSSVAAAPARIKLIILIVLAVAFTIAFPIICNSTGRGFGTAVGTAVGTFQAVTEDMPAAYEQGVNDGLSAKDTRTEMQEKLQAVGKLDVLAATAQLTDFHEVGNKFAALYQLGADVIFSVDITKAKVLVGGNDLEIVLPKPEVEINIDSTKTRLEDYWQNWLFNGSTEQGINAYINSMKMIQGDAKKTLAEYQTLEAQAEESARRQVLLLAGFIAAPDVNITVHFEDMGGES